MRKSHKLIVSLLLALLLVGVVPSTSTASSDVITSEIVRGTVKWTLTPEQCPSIDLRIKGTGKRVQVITTTTKSDGSQEIIDGDVVNGTAVDREGGKYYFIYSNQTRQSVPRHGSPVKVYMIDTFMLTGNDGANNLNVNFAWRWTYRPPEEEIWPPVHNWEQIQTIGDPLHCDPI